ncbi:MAG: hypothetical protein ACE5KZ_06325 [Candidatus Scalinduaceae bacterium]
MKIGEFFVKNNYITLEAKNDALEFQKNNRDLRIGEILVKINAITKEQLGKYVSEYEEVDKENV